MKLKLDRASPITNTYIGCKLLNSGHNRTCFADDTQILLGIIDKEYTQILQNDLHKLYKWADTNNMKCNANKFESATTYK